MVKTASWTHGPDLRRFREEHLRISQQAAATRVGVSLGADGAWERGASEPTQENLAVIVGELRVPPATVGYVAPPGWELVPAEWIRQELTAAEERARVRHDEVVKALGDVLNAVRARG